MDTKSNWCSLSPDRIFKYDISTACMHHDEAYEAKEPLTAYRRYKADYRLLQEIKAKLPIYLRWIAYIYYIAVRIGGQIYEEK